MKYIFAVDGGGTKTYAVIASQDGTVLGRASVGSMNFNTHNVEEFELTLTEALRAAILAAVLDTPVFTAACLGIAGLDTEPAIQDATEVARRVVPLAKPKNLLVVNDIQLVRAACLQKKYGISVIVGTGSNFYGINKKGEEAYAGGLDYLLSDEGSSYWVGTHLLQAAVRSADGRGKKTILQEIVRERFQIKNIRELADVVYRETFDKRKVADIGKLIDVGYTKNDPVATQILEDAVQEIALGINTLIKRLGMKDDTFDIVMAGGIFNSPFPFKEKIQAQIIAKQAQLVLCDKKPVEGAVKLALKMVTR